jgi:hypothetical protein
MYSEQKGTQSWGKQSAARFAPKFTLTLDAVQGRRHSIQTFFRDVAVAIDTRAIGALLDACQRRVNFGETRLGILRQPQNAFFVLGHGSHVRVIAFGGFDRSLRAHEHFRAGMDQLGAYGLKVQRCVLSNRMLRPGKTSFDLRGFTVRAL